MTPSDREHSDEEPTRPDSPGPAMSEAEAWEQIVANYGERVLPGATERDAHPAGRGRTQPTEDEVARGSEDVDDPDHTSGDSAPAGTDAHVVIPDAQAHPDRDHVAEREARIERSEGFVPPAPPPLPPTSWPRLVAWAGAIGVPLVLLVAMFAGLTLPRVVLGIAMGWFVAGFMFLVATMSREPRDPWDDGSRV
ncbi:MAG: hypothetical protein ACI379_07145 [Nocardioides sp.]|uniref:hypothetical protein n=1 Tax=Nocardioides sp. TaxID=35761 RepID=UPI003F085DF0